jgi:small-conductance mechanosensitive channel
MSVLSGFVGQGQFDEFRAFIEELATTEGRLAVSGAILLLTLLVTVLIAPVLLGRVGAGLRDRLPEGRATGAIDLLSEYIPTTIGGFFLRLIQLTLIGTAVIALLVVWGLVDVAIQLLTIVGFSLPLVAQLFLTVLLFLFAYIASDLLGETIQELGEDASRVTDHQQEIVKRMVNLGVLALAVMAALTLWGLNLSGLLVGAGFLGIVVGMAARQTLGSMIAGFVLMFSRPFTIGDWVEIGSHEGIVTNITIMNTRLRNFDGESIVIPNDIASNRAVTNRSEQGHLRLRLEVGIDYETDPDHAERVALEAIESVESVAASPPPDVVPTGFGNSEVVLEMRFWIDRPTPPRKWRTIRGVINSVKSRFEEEDITIPFPQRELSARGEAGGFRIPDSEGRGESTGHQVETPTED